ANGTYAWGVKALDVAGKEIGASPSWTFTVDTGLRAASPTQIAAPDSSAVGKTLTSVPPTWNQPDVQVTYQWLRGGSAITGATGTSYTLTVQDYTKAITLRVTGTKPGYSIGLSVSNEISGTAGGALQNTAMPSISGTAAVGNTLTATTGTWAPAATKYGYQWLRSGAPIPNATSSSYRLSVEDAGKSISVTVLASTTGFNEGASSSAAVAVARMTSTTSIALSTTRAKPGKRVKIGITVTVPGVPGPTGPIAIFDGAKKLKTLTLVSTRDGKLAWKLTKLKKGKHKIKAVYLGNGSTTGSKSKITKLYVVR
ncbi:Ig-like domain repeat protein, partial [Nocardioides sp. P5_C9_2]